MMWDDSWGWGWGMGWMMMFGWLPLLLLGLIVYALMQAVDRGRSGAVYPTSPPPPPAPPALARRDETPLEVAQRRYASGELSRDEFMRIRDDLGGGGTPPAG